MLGWAGRTRAWEPQVRAIYSSRNGSLKPFATRPPLGRLPLVGQEAAKMSITLFRGKVTGAQHHRRPKKTEMRGAGNHRPENQKRLRARGLSAILDGTGGRPLAAKDHRIDRQRANMVERMSLRR